MNLGVSLFQYNTSVFFRQTNIPTQICSQLTLLTSEVGRFLGAADYPKQSDQALHRCLYNRKSVKNDCVSNCLAFTCKNKRPVEASRSHTGRYNHCE